MSMRAVNPWDWGGVEGRASRFEEGEGTAAGGQRRRSSRLRLERMREEGEEKWLVNTLQPWTGGFRSIEQQQVAPGFYKPPAEEKPRWRVKDL